MEQFAHRVLTGNSVSALLANLPAGGSVVLNVTGTVNGTASGAIVNTAGITPAAGVLDPNGGNNTASSTTPIVLVADVSVVKTGPAAANASGPITYIITVRNAGPSQADGTTITDVVPASITGVSAVCSATTGSAVCPPAINIAANTVSANVPVLPAGSSVTFQVSGTVLPTANGSVVNSATAAVPAGTVDPNPGNDTGTAATPVTPVADLIIEKFVVPALNAADPISYTVKVTNLGPSTALDSVMTDNVPPAVTGVVASCSGEQGGALCPSSVVVTGNNVSATIPSLPAGASVVFSIKGQLTNTASGDIDNQASIATAAGVVDPTPNNNDSIARTKVTPLADLSITKRRVDNTAFVQAGSTVVYEIVLRNAGPAAATGVGIKDDLPASLLNTTWSCSVTGTGDCDTAKAGTDATGTGSVLLNNVSIAPGAGNAVTIRLTAKVANNVQQSIVNVATLQVPPSIIDPNPNNDIATDRSIVAPSLRGSVFADDNADRAKNSSETPIAGLTVTVTPDDGSPAIVVTTDANGEYVVPVTPGKSYTVVVTSPAGKVATTRNNPQKIVADADGSQVIASPVGFAVASSVSGTVWRDTDHDRVRGSSEPPVSGFKVEVLDFEDKVVASSLTDASGNYSIAGLVPSNPTDPNTFYKVRFVDPANNVLYGRPLSNDPIQKNGKTENGIIEALPLLPGVNTGNQNLPLDPSGVVYNSVTREPVAGALVRLIGPGGFDASRHLLGGPAQQSQTTSANGYYEFWLLPSAPSGSYSLEVTAPQGLISPSAQIPAQASEAQVPSTGNVFAVQPQANAPSNGQDTTYYLRLQLAVGGDQVVNNHIPLDPASPSELFTAKSVDKTAVELGDTLRYTISVRHVSGPGLNNLAVLDTLPAGFRYIPGTARVQADVNSPLTVTPDPTGGVGPALSFNVGRLAPNQLLILSYRVRVGVGAMQGDGINRAYAQSGTSRSNTAQAGVKVTEGVFTSDACIVGKVFVDCNNNHIQDSEELGIPGVKLYLENGISMISDAEGKYSYCGLKPMSHVLKIDSKTLPQGSRLKTTSNRNLGDAHSLLIDAQNGQQVRADFLEGSCSSAVLDEVKARRSKGEVRSKEPAKARSGLTFTSAPQRDKGQSSGTSVPSSTGMQTTVDGEDGALRR